MPTTIASINGVEIGCTQKEGHGIYVDATGACGHAISFFFTGGIGGLFGDVVRRGDNVWCRECR